MAETIRYFSDQHIPRAVTDGLTRRGIDVLTASGAGRCGYTDEEQLVFAEQEGRVLVTFDSDFLALHQSGWPHSGIAWCPATKYRIGELLQRLVLLHAVVPPDQMRGTVEYL